MDKTLSPADLDKAAGTHAEIIPVEQARELLDAYPSGSRPRIYGYLARGECAGQLVKIHSTYYLDKHGTDLQAVWLSHTTLADLVSKT